MPEFAKALLEFLKLAPRYLVALSVATAVLLFGPEPFLRRLSVSDFAQQNRSWIGLVFLFSSVLFGVDRTVAITKWLRRKRISKAAMNAAVKHLNNLTEQEKQILRFYIAKGTKTNYLKIDDGVVQGLAGTKIIYRAASIGSVLDGFAFNISDFAWDYLKDHPALLNGTTLSYRTDKRETYHDPSMG